MMLLYTSVYLEFIKRAIALRRLSRGLLKFAEIAPHAKHKQDMQHSDFHLTAYLGMAALRRDECKCDK